MTKVVDLSGNPVAGADDTKLDDALPALKALVAKIESGEIKGICHWLFIYARTDEEVSPGLCLRASMDSGMTVEKAHFETEIFQDWLLNAYR
jgi:hypothetical protein